MLKTQMPKGLSATEFLTAVIGVMTVLGQTVLADTVYRCGEAYSTSSQCANRAATEVKPTPVLQSTEPDKGHTATRDLREAQALEKQRLQAERQAAQTAPVGFTTAIAQTANPPPNVTHNEPRVNMGKGKQARKPNSPYFTAVDPTTAPKKKSTAKTVPAPSNP